MSKYDVAIRIGALTDAYKHGLADARNGTARFAAQAKADIDGIKRAWTSVAGKLATIGLGIGAMKLVAESARVDKSLIRVRQTAGATAEQAKSLRKELFLMGQETGNSFEGLMEGFNSLVQSGQTWDQAKSTISAINTAMAVTDAQSSVLARGLTIAAEAFDFDLSKPGLALALLDKMTLAGRSGNSELEHLSDIFAQIGVNAKSAGLSFDGTLAFVETLSMAEPDPSRLGTMADASLRIFNDLKKMRKTQAQTGIRFFDAAGERRDAFSVYADIKAKYDKLATDEQQAQFMGRVFEGGDIRTMHGLRTLMKGDTIARGQQLVRQIESASGTLERDLPEALRNSVDQAARLKNVMRETGEKFARPVNKALADMIEQGLKSKDKGGLGLGGGDILGGGLAIGLTGWLLSRVGKRAGSSMLSRFLGGAGGLAAGVAEGKAVEAATGVTPVFVTNWPSGGLAGLSGGGGGGGLSGGRWQEYFGMGGAAGKAARLPWWKLGGLSAGGGGILSKIVGVAGPVGLAASATYEIEKLLGGITNVISKGVYQNVEEAIFDMFAGGKIGKAAKAIANNTNVNVTIQGNGKVLADTSSTSGTSRTSINTLSHGMIE